MSCPRLPAIARLRHCDPPPPPDTRLPARLRAAPPPTRPHTPRPPGRHAARPGTPVTVAIAALGGQPISAAITRTAAADNPQTRTMRAEADLDNADNLLTTGVYAIVVVTLESKEQAMMIPSKSIRGTRKDKIVLVVNDGVAQPRPIIVGYNDGIWAEVLSGLDGNEAIITAASGAVTAGTAVAVVQAGL